MSTASKLYVLCSLMISVAAAESLKVVNASFGNVGIQCVGGIATQSYEGGACTGSGNEQQDFNSAVGIGWTFASFQGDANPNAHNSDGMTYPNTIFDTPSFVGLPFSQAVFLQGPNAAIAQTITGFVPGNLYRLSFYLGSRYASGSFDGNQTVKAIVDEQVIGEWALASYTPFTLQSVPFLVTTGGSHTVKFEGIMSGDHTAFFSGVSVGTTGALTVTPSSGEPGARLVASAGGFAPLEQVNLIAYAGVPVVIGTANADANGNVSVAGRLVQTPYGACGLRAIGQSSGANTPGLISVIPRVSASPNTGAIGSTVTLTGFGFAAGETVNVEWSRPQISLGSRKANQSGTISLPFAVPAGANGGTAEVIATGQKTGASASVQITVE